MAGVTEVFHGYAPREPFKLFHGRSQRFAVLVYHRRAGKTVATVNDLVAKALKCRKKHGHFAYLAPFMGQVEQTAWAYLKDAVRNIPGHKISETKKYVEVPSAHGTLAKIRLFGADNPDSLRGLYFDGIVLDEVADMKANVWTDVIRPAMMDRGGWAVFIGTPKGKNFFYDLVETAKKETDKWFLQILKASESGLIKQEELNDYRAEVDEDTYEQEMECSFTAGIKGAYYAKLINDLEEDGRLQPFEHVKNAPVHLALDLGIDDATAAWFWQVINGEKRYIDYDEWTDIDIHKIISDIKAKGYRLGDWWLPHDAKARSLQTGKTMIEQFRSKGINPKAVPEIGLLEGIQAVRRDLPRIAGINGSKCYQGLEALKAYQKKWDAERGVFRKVPNHDWSSHAADSFRYSCLATRDSDLAASVRPRKPSMSSSDSYQQWLASASLNTAVTQGPTLDELFSRQSRGDYIRI